MYRRTEEQLTEFIKKKYQSCLVDEILSLYSEIDSKNKVIEDNNKTIEKLNTKIALLESKVNSPEFILSEAFRHYLNEKGFDDDTIKSGIKTEIKSAVEHMSVDVEGYYEEYSGQNKHYHKATVSLNNY